MDTTETITHLPLCSGYDGIGLGLKRIWNNVREIAHVEIEAFAAANLVAKMEAGELDAAPVWTDLKTFPAWAFRGCVDILSAGFPCQPFSAAGKGKADDDPRHLWPYVRQTIGLIRPRVVVLENVEGIISSKLKGRDWHDPEGTPVLLHVLRELERTGYRCTWGVFSASEVGAPHQRKRVFIAGVDDSGGSKFGWLSNFWGQEDTTTRKSGGRPEELADSVRGRFEQCKSKCEKEDFVSQGGQHTRWPARPGEEQYEWEEPRVTEAQSELGGAVDGLTHRVDRLRLLGNGVVPATCERAVRTLIQELHFSNP